MAFHPTETFTDFYKMRNSKILKVSLSISDFSKSESEDEREREEREKEREREREGERAGILERDSPSPHV
jgi:hypothetical protein